MVLDSRCSFSCPQLQTKCKQSKTEGNAAQNALQKEITTLRDSSRALQLKLRDIEVANDDYERQARNTTSSMEDLDYKYNAAIERGVLLEEEIKGGDQEREQLRIENQRLRDELSDLKIETEIVQERLRNAESGGGRRARKPTPLYRSPSTPQTPEIFDRSPGTSTVSSPMFTTPPAKMTLASSTATPPSPPISETSSNLRKSINATPGFPRQKASAGESLNSRSLHGTRSTQRIAHARAASMAYGNRNTTPSAPSRTSMPRFNHTANNSSTSSISNNNNNSVNGNRTSGLPKSGSLCQIRGLIGKMQKLEERVHSAKSKLPPPSESPSRASSRSGSVMGDSPVASTITVRRDSRKRLSGSSFSSSVRDGDVPSYLPQSRPSFSVRTPGDSRPSSRTSYSSRSSISYSTHPSLAPSSTRPESRQSRTKTPLGHYSTNPITESRRPPSALSNNATQSPAINGMSHIDEDEDLATDLSMRATISEHRGARLPSVSATNSGWKKRSTSGIPAPRTLKTSTGDRTEGSMGPAERKPQLTDLGETF